MISYLSARYGLLVNKTKSTVAVTDFLYLISFVEFRYWQCR